MFSKTLKSSDSLGQYSFKANAIKLTLEFNKLECLSLLDTTILV